MRPTRFVSDDNISVWALKQAQQQLNPPLLQLVNTIISTGIFPQQLKTTKIVPVQKPNKPSTSSEGWRPVNIVAALAKVTEKVLLSQIMEFLKDNNLISHIHHGSVQAKSTQTLVIEIYDQLIQNINNDQDTALVLLDQSKAYEMVPHNILLQKFKTLGFKSKALQLMTSYLSDRKQYVHL